MKPKTISWIIHGNERQTHIIKLGLKFGKVSILPFNFLWLLGTYLGFVFPCVFNLVY